MMRLRVLRSLPQTATASKDRQVPKLSTPGRNPMAINFGRQVWGEFSAAGVPHPLWRIGWQSGLAAALPLAVALSGPTELLGFGLVGAFGASYGGTLRGRERIVVVTIMAIFLPVLALTTTAVHTIAGGSVGLPAEYGWLLVVVLAGLVVLPTLGIGPPGVTFLIVTTSIGWTRHETAGIVAPVAMALLGGVGTIGLVMALEWRSRSDTFPRASDRTKPTFNSLQVTQFSAVAIAGALCLIESLPRLDWAMLTASIMLTRGYRLPGSLARGLHRLIGTGVGLAIFAGLTARDLPPWAYLPILVILQFWIDATIAWRYALAVAGITPLVLSIGILTTNDTAPIGVRIVETLLGIASALGVVTAARSFRTPFRWRFGGQKADRSTRGQER